VEEFLFLVPIDRSNVQLGKVQGPFGKVAKLCVSIALPPV